MKFKAPHSSVYRRLDSLSKYAKVTFLKVSLSQLKFGSTFFVTKGIFNNFLARLKFKKVGMHSSRGIYIKNLNLIALS